MKLHVEARLSWNHEIRGHCYRGWPSFLGPPEPRLASSTRNGTRRQRARRGRPAPLRVSSLGAERGSGVGAARAPGRHEARENGDREQDQDRDAQAPRVSRGDPEEHALEQPAEREARHIRTIGYMAWCSLTNRYPCSVLSRSPERTRPRLLPGSPARASAASPHGEADQAPPAPPSSCQVDASRRRLGHPVPTAPSARTPGPAPPGLRPARTSSTIRSRNSRVYGLRVFPIVVPPLKRIIVHETGATPDPRYAALLRM
jgi:hypothetical protein